MGLWQRIFGNPIQKIEKRSGDFTSELMAIREAHIHGRRGIAELTATVQAAVALWESSFAMADVTGTSLLDRCNMASAARCVALRGEALFLIQEDGLVPASDWDVSTRQTRPVAYRLSIADAGGGFTQTALAAEVLHFKIGTTPSMPWRGVAPLRRAPLTAGLLTAVESALSEVFDTAPIGSQVLPFPETPQTDMTALGRSFRGQRGRVLLRESVAVSAAGGPVPASDWRPSDLTPDLSRSMTVETWNAARDSILAAFGLIPSWLNPQAQGPLVREAQRQLAQWTLQPMAELFAEEATEKLGTPVTIDVIAPLQAFDAGGRARAFSSLITAIAAAKSAGLTTDDLAASFGRVNWDDENG